MENLNFLQAYSFKWISAGIMLLFLVACTRTQTANKSSAATVVSSVPVTKADSAKWPASFNFGKPASPQEIALLDIDVR